MRGRVWLRGLTLAACFLAAGCASTLDKIDVGNILGPTGRRAKEAAEKAQASSLSQPLEGTRELDEAQKLFDAEKYDEARKAFGSIAKKYKDKPAEEDAMFMIGECWFRMRRYPRAQDAYDELFKKYPSTRHIEKATQHLFAIASHWLGAPKPASEIELAQFTTSDGVRRLDDIPEARVPYQFPLTPNLLDRSRPLFDTHGRALQALRSVWINDPTGPLADDALMLSATHKLRRRDFREAERDFATIREMYADGPHAPSAYVLGSYASWNSYQGARYDGRQLDEARKLTESAVRLYPDLPQRPKLLADLKRMKEQDAERLWARIEYHMKRREKDAAAIHAEYILKLYPESRYAKPAREMLVQLGPEHAAGILKTPVVEPQPETIEVAEPEDRDDAPREPARVRVSDGEAKLVPEGE